MTKLAYKIIGQGPDLVLVHGWGMHSEIWQPVLAGLADYYRLTLIDLPGHGRSRGVMAASIDDVADMLLEVAPDRAFWVGWSLGGQIVTQLALLYPERATKLLLVASNPCFIRKNVWQNAVPSGYLQQFANELQEDWLATIKRFIALQFLGTQMSPKELRTLQQQMSRLPADVQALQQGLHWLQTVDLRSQIAELGMPVQFILGRLDRLVPAGLAETLVEMGMEVELLDGAGHAPFISHPEVFCNVLRQFFNEGADVGY